MNNNEKLLNLMLSEHRKSKEESKKLNETTNSFILGIGKMLNDNKERR